MYLRYRNGVLEASDPHSQEAIEELKEGQIYKVKASKPRHLPFHRKFFALLNNVVDQSDYFTGKKKSLALDELLDRVKVKTGHIETVGMMYGVQLVKPKSIAFDKMDNIQFEDFYNTAIDAIKQDKELNVPNLVTEGF